MALGNRLQRLCVDAEASYGVRLDPRKPEMVALAPEDRVIVLAGG